MEIKDIENLAELARIELSLDEKKGLLSDMDSILEYVKQIQSVSVESVKSKEDNYNSWREDVLSSRDFSHDLIVGQFPCSQPARPPMSGAGGGVFLKVKKIL